MNEKQQEELIEAVRSLIDVLEKHLDRIEAKRGE